MSMYKAQYHAEYSHVCNANVHKKYTQTFRALHTKKHMQISVFYLLKEISWGGGALTSMKITMQFA